MVLSSSRDTSLAIPIPLEEGERTIVSKALQLRLDNARLATGATVVILRDFRKDSFMTSPSVLSTPDKTRVKGVLQKMESEPFFSPFQGTVLSNSEPVPSATSEFARNTTCSDPEEFLGIFGEPEYSSDFPLMVSGQLVGSLSFHWTCGPSHAQLYVVGQAFAAQFSLVWEKDALQQALQGKLTELRASQKQLINAEERQRKEISELLHGAVQTRLLVAAHRLRQCHDLLRTSPTKGIMLLADITREIDQIREQEVRQASHLLHPSIITVGLVPAVNTLAKRFEDFFGIMIHVDGEVKHLDDVVANKIPQPLRLAAYRVVEEALNNAYRHARAHAVKIILAITPDQQLRIVVEDDGRGFDPNNCKPGLGLNSIAARVGLLDGSWNVTSTPGKGTKLDVLLPLRTETDLEEGELSKTSAF